MNISVIIVNYNAGAYLTRCVEALLQQDYPPFEVLIVDNASSDGSLDTIPKDHRIRILPFTENLGFAAANNRAALQAKGSWIALLNPDAFPQSDWLRQLATAAEQHPEFAMFGSTQINAHHPGRLDGSGDIYHILGIPVRSNYQHPLSSLPATGEVFSPCAAAAMYSRELFLEEGGFDERFFCYCEDIDLAFRLRLKGARCLQVKEAVVYHVGSGISGKSSSFSYYYGMRNRFWVFVKNMPPALFIPLLPLHLALQFLFFFIGVYRGQAKAACRAWKDTLHHLPYLLKARRHIQAQRTLSTRHLCRAFTYSFLTLFLRKSDIRPVNSSSY